MIANFRFWNSCSAGRWVEDELSYVPPPVKIAAPTAGISLAIAPWFHERMWCLGRPWARVSFCFACITNSSCSIHCCKLPPGALLSWLMQTQAALRSVCCGKWKWCAAFSVAKFCPFSLSNLVMFCFEGVKIDKCCLLVFLFSLNPVSLKEETQGTIW